MEFNATFIASAISFIVFVFIMNAIFYKPLQSIVDKRQSFIDDTNKETKAHKEKTETVLKDKAKKIESTKHEAKKIITAKTEDVKNEKAKLAAQAQQESAQKVEGAKSELQKSYDEAQGILTDETKKLAQDIAAKILGNAKM